MKEYKVDPPADNDPNRVPITEASQRGVLDPMTAALVRMPGNGDPLVPEACQRTQEVFDGRLRYDMQFSFKRMDRVKAIKGYSGPVVVCSAYFHRSPALSLCAAIRYLAKQRDMEVWLAVPIAGTRVLVPFRARADTDRPGNCRGVEFVSIPIRPGLRPMVPRRNKPLDSPRAGGDGAVLTFGTAYSHLNEGPLLHLVVAHTTLARCRRERSHTAPESAIRARFVPDSF